MTPASEGPPVAPVGERIAKYRELRKMTAAQLAETIPSPGVSRSIIVNIENGRKRDLTSTELMQVAAGLRVPVTALLVDSDDPWAPVRVPLPKPYAALSNAEYLVANDAMGADDQFAADWQTAHSHRATNVLVSLRRLEHDVFDIATIRSVDAGIDLFQGKRWGWLDRADGTYAAITEEDLRDESIRHREKDAALRALTIVDEIRWIRKFIELPEWLVARVRSAIAQVSAYGSEASTSWRLLDQFERTLGGTPSNSDK